MNTNVTGLPLHLVVLSYIYRMYIYIVYRMISFFKSQYYTNRAKYIFGICTDTLKGDS